MTWTQPDFSMWFLEMVANEMVFRFQQGQTQINLVIFPEIPNTYVPFSSALVYDVDFVHALIILGLVIFTQSVKMSLKTW